MWDLGFPFDVVRLAPVKRKTDGVSVARGCHMAIAPRPAKLRPVRSDCQRAKSQQTQRQKKRKSASIHMVQSFAESEERAFVVFHDRRVMCQLRQVNDARFSSEDPKRIRGLPGFNAITPRSTSLILAVKACVMNRKKTHPNSTRSVTSGALRVLSACLRHVASNPALQSLGAASRRTEGIVPQIEGGFQK